MRGYSLNKDMTKTLIFLFYCYPRDRKPFHFDASKTSDRVLKNHYIISSKPSINKGKACVKSRLITYRKSIGYKVVK